MPPHAPVMVLNPSSLPAVMSIQSLPTSVKGLSRTSSGLIILNLFSVILSPLSQLYTSTPHLSSWFHCLFQIDSLINKDRPH